MSKIKTVSQILDITSDDSHFSTFRFTGALYTVRFLDLLTTHFERQAVICYWSVFDIITRVSSINYCKINLFSY